MIDAFQAANRVCALSGWTMTHLKIQKILYLLHLLYLGEKKNPLIDDRFEAWTHGPVLPTLYKKLKVFSKRTIPDIFYFTVIDESSDEIKFIDSKYHDLAKKDAWELVIMTHLKGGAWEKYFDQTKEKNQRLIPNADILKEYEMFYAKA